VILLFWFLILALALAWGIAGFQEDRLEAHKPPPPAAHAPAAAKPAVPVAPAAQDAAGATTTTDVDKDAAKPDDAR